jgi:prophage endopeptidase
MLALITQYRLLLTGLAVAALMAMSAAGAWQWQANAYGRQIAEQGRAHEHTLGEIARAAARQLQAQQDKRLALEQRLTTLDADKHKVLTDAESENERLRRLYDGADDERRRLRIEVRVARADATVSAATSPGSLGDGERLELSAEAGSAVWDIRGGMKSDEAKLDYLQRYVCELRPDLSVCK